MDIEKEKYAYILIEIENWVDLKNSHSASELAILLAHFSELVAIKFGDSFRSLINSSGEMFIIASYLSKSKSILKFISELKHQFNTGTEFFPKQLIVSIAMTTKDKDMEPYDILLYLKQVLQKCRAEKQSNILCVA